MSSAAESQEVRAAKQAAWDFRFYGTARAFMVRKLLPTNDITMHNKPKQGQIVWIVDGRHTITWINDGDPEFTVTNGTTSSSANDLSKIVEWMKQNP